MKYEIKPLNMGQAFGTAFSLYWNNFLFLFISAAATMTAYTLTTMGLLGPTIQSMAKAGPANIGSALSYVGITMGLWIVFDGIFTCFSTLYLSKRYLGQGRDIRGFTAAALKGLPGVFLLSFLSFLFMIVPAGVIYGILLYIFQAAAQPWAIGAYQAGMSIEAIQQTVLVMVIIIVVVVIFIALLLLLRTLYNIPIYLVEKKGAFRAFGRGMKLARGNKGRLLVFVLATVGMVVLLSYLSAQLSLAAHNNAVGTVISIAILGIMYPFYSCGKVALYFSARAEKEGFALERLVEEFGGAPAAGTGVTANAEAVADAPKGEGNA